jgi:carbonic anhydrase/acetyltransferase-like protein (isoleucine patch superfamily)
MTGLQIIVGIRNRLRMLLHRYWHTPWLWFRLRGRGMQVGKRLQAYGWPQLSLHHSARVSIGVECRLVSSFHYTAVGGHHPLHIYVGPNASLEIGNRVGMSNCSIICCSAIKIGDDVRLGGDCRIYDSDFHSIEAIDRIERGDKATKMSPVTIGNRVFIGAHAIILKGVSIGTDSVVGAGAVVTRNVPAGEIWAGNPARFVRRLGEGRNI